MERDKYIELVKGSALGWIGSADAKATALLSIAGVILGLNSLAGGAAPFSFRLAYGISTFVCVGSCAMVLWPRTNRKALINDETVEVSPTFFGDIAKRTYKEFADLAGRSNATGLLEEDATEQAYVVAKIAAKKMWWMRIAVVAFVVSLAVVSAQLVFAKDTDAATGASSAPIGNSP
jgi:hypothetical protein